MMYMKYLCGTFYNIFRWKVNKMCETTLLNTFSFFILIDKLWVAYSFMKFKFKKTSINAERTMM